MRANNFRKRVQIVLKCDASVLKKWNQAWKCNYEKNRMQRENATRRRDLGPALLMWAQSKRKALHLSYRSICFASKYIKIQSLCDPLIIVISELYEFDYQFFSALSFPFFVRIASSKLHFELNYTFVRSLFFSSFIFEINYLSNWSSF